MIVLKLQPHVSLPLRDIFPPPVIPPLPVVPPVAPVPGSPVGAAAGAFGEDEALDAQDVLDPAGDDAAPDRAASPYRTRSG